MWAEGDSPFARFPIELKWKIFGILKLADKRSCRLVCSHWLAIVDEKLKCRAFLTDKTKSWILTRSHFKSLTVENLTKTVSMSSLQDTAPSTDQLVIGRGNSSPNILNILRFFCNQINCLRFQSLSLSGIHIASFVDILRNREWSNLSSLSVTMGSNARVEIDGKNSKSHIQAVIQIFKCLKIPTLRNLTINFSKGLYFDKPWKETFNFICKHGQSLRGLKLALLGSPKPPPLEAQVELFSQLKDLKLKRFGITYDEYHCAYAYELSQRVEELDQLEVMTDFSLRNELFYAHLHNSRSHSESYKVFKIDRILHQHVKTLKILRCQFCPNAFDLSWLIGYDSLEILELKTCNLDGLGMMPSLSGLRKISIFEFTPSRSLDLLIRYMVDRMPNLEVVELIVRHQFQVTQLNIIMSLHGIRKLTINRWDNSLRDFCQRGNPWLSFRTEKKICTSVSGCRDLSFEQAIIQFNRVVTPTHNTVV